MCRPQMQLSGSIPPTCWQCLLRACCPGRKYFASVRRWMRFRKKCCHELGPHPVAVITVAAFVAVGRDLDIAGRHIQIPGAPAGGDLDLADAVLLGPGGRRFKVAIHQQVLPARLSLGSERRSRQHNGRQHAGHNGDNTNSLLHDDTPGIARRKGRGVAAAPGAQWYSGEKL
jgi:hypothetical protein